MKKRVYTITFQRALNYGASLQAYALAKFLLDRGYDVRVIDYLPRYFALQTYRPAKSFRGSIRKLKKIIRFNRFIKDNIPLTEHMCFSESGLKKLPHAHAVICGSDQIWNKKLTGGKFDGGFFLEWVPERTRRIAYAASSGAIEMSDFADVLGETLYRFDRVGVREESLQRDLSLWSPSVSSEVVLDPSLLIDNYDDILDCSRIPEGDYILSYVVGSGEMVSGFDHVIQNVKKITDLPVIHIGAKEIVSANRNILDIGPAEWAAFFKKAKFVVTNSFHGTTFSLNFQRNFMFVPHVIEVLNDRQRTLLSALGLSSLEYTGDEIGDLESFYVDYEEVEPRLKKLVDKSRKFLVDSIE